MKRVERDTLERFRFEYQEYHRISPKRADQQRKTIKQFGEFAERPLKELSPSDFQQFAGAMMASGLHVNTVRKKMNMIRPFISWMYAVNLISADRYLAFKNIKNPRGSTGRSNPKPYAAEEVRGFWNLLDERYPAIGPTGYRSKLLNQFIESGGQTNFSPLWRHAMRIQIEAMVRLALDLGLRRSEIYGLSINDLHYDNEYIVVRGKADPHTGEVQVRRVPWTKECIVRVTAWVEFRELMHPATEAAWLVCYGPRYNQAMRFQRFEALISTGVHPDYSWHRFRHTCATQWLRAGVDLALVSNLLGHASLQQTLAYAKIDGVDLQAALTKYEDNFDVNLRREEVEEDVEEDVA